MNTEPLIPFDVNPSGVIHIELLPGEDGSIEKRTFRLAPYALIMKAWFRGLLAEYRTVHPVGETDHIPFKDLIEFIAASPERTNACMRAGFAGTHDGIDWARDVDGDHVEAAIIYFFGTTLTRRAGKPVGSTTSSGNTTASSRNKARSAVRASTSKKRRGR